MMNSKYIAPQGSIWMCRVCEKVSRDRRGDPGIRWDESCFVNAILLPEEYLEIDEHGYVTGIKSLMLDGWADSL